jgi:hypothetical protein
MAEQKSTARGWAKLLLGLFFLLLGAAPALDHIKRGRSAYNSRNLAARCSWLF